MLVVVQHGNQTIRPKIPKFNLETIVSLTLISGLVEMERVSGMMQYKSENFMNT